MQNRTIARFAVAVCLVGVTGGSALAQGVAVDFPEAPSSVAAYSSSASMGGSGGQKHEPQVSGRYDSVVLDGQTAYKLTAHDKFIMGFRETFAPFSIAEWPLGAGYGQLTDGSPNYGVNGRAFAQRLGAAAAKDTSQDLFQFSVLAPLLHEDPRYYKMGKGHSVLRRTGYALTRPLIGKTDSGHITPNLAFLGADAGASALTNLYYPQVNHGFSETSKAFATSIGTSALGKVVDEFLADALEVVHLKKAKE